MSVEPIAELVSQAHDGRAEYTFRQLFEVFSIPQGTGTLEGIALVDAHLKQWKLMLLPGITAGEVDTVRRVLFFVQPTIDSHVLNTIISAGESSEREFKSSLLYDYKRVAANPNLKGKDCASELVLHSILKTIAAFLNTNGGVLCIGIEDSGTILGVEPDFPCITETVDKQNIDQWQLHFANCVQNSFIDGKSVNDYVQCTTVEVNQRQVAHIKVGKRRKLSFLKTKGEIQLFRRQGNKTEKVQFQDIEEFLMSRDWRPPN